MNFVWQTSYPLQMVQVWVAIFVLNTGVCGFFLSVKFAASLIRFAHRGIIWKGQRFDQKSLLIKKPIITVHKKLFLGIDS